MFTGRNTFHVFLFLLSGWAIVSLHSRINRTALDVANYIVNGPENYIDVSLSEEFGSSDLSNFASLERPAFEIATANQSSSSLNEMLPSNLILGPTDNDNTAIAAITSSHKYSSRRS